MVHEPHQLKLVGPPQVIAAYKSGKRILSISSWLGLNEGQNGNFKPAENEGQSGNFKFHLSLTGSSLFPFKWRGSGSTRATTMSSMCNKFTEELTFRRGLGKKDPVFGVIRSVGIRMPVFKKKIILTSRVVDMPDISGIGFLRLHRNKQLF